MRVPIGLNSVGADLFFEWINLHYKGAPLSDFDKRAWMSDFSTRLGQDSDARDYEMSALESNTGTPLLFHFTDAHLEFNDYE